MYVPAVHRRPWRSDDVAHALTEVNWISMILLSSVATGRALVDPSMFVEVPKIAPRDVGVPDPDVSDSVAASAVIAMSVAPR